MWVFPKCCGLRAARNAQVSGAHSGDINVGVQLRRRSVDYDGPMAHGMLAWWWDVALSSVLSRALDTEHRASARYTGSPLLFLSAAVVVDFLPRSGLAQAAATFNSTLDASHQRAATAADQQAFTSSASRNSKRNKILGGTFMCSCL